MARGNAGGDPIAIKDVQPDDILQFRDYEVTTTTVTKYQFEDGASETVTIDDVAERGHHTAVVNGTLDSNGVVKTLDQHVKPLGESCPEQEPQYARRAGRDARLQHQAEAPTNEEAGVGQGANDGDDHDQRPVWAYRPKAKP